MRHSMWTYAWDVQDVGFDTVVAELRGAGLNGVSLATSYHAGRFLRPRGSARKVYFPEDGTIYFTPNPAHWKGVRLEPQVSSVVGQGDVLRRVVDTRETTGLAVHAGQSACTTCGSDSRCSPGRTASISTATVSSRRRASNGCVLP